MTVMTYRSFSPSGLDIARATFDIIAALCLIGIGIFPTMTHKEQMQSERQHEDLKQMKKLLSQKEYASYKKQNAAPIVKDVLCFSKMKAKYSAFLHQAFAFFVFIEKTGSNTFWVLRCLENTDEHYQFFLFLNFVADLSLVILILVSLFNCCCELVLWRWLSFGSEAVLVCTVLFTAGMEHLHRNRGFQAFGALYYESTNGNC